ncbi:SPOR domain-containing protein [Tenacibaculum holothuriorum]|uniref:SPOR domain-containing protein n=1 Tax=Tenacibaculum holothuriorum TaxID=1635173 RepID=UPI000A323BCB|nr:SPOR domain-containing protein [Tenacibaculum holothuriorum]
MPFIEEEKFSLMQQDLDNAKLKREEAENELQQVIDDKSRLKRVSIFIGALLGLALTAVGYFYSNGGNGLEMLKKPKVDIAAVKAKEAKRVLDSVKKAQSRVKKSQNNSKLNTANINETVNELNNNTKGNTIYSVQVGVFSNRKYPLISKKFIPGNIASADGYFKYSLGLFSTLNEAKYLRNELRKVGFKDAFVASYVNGKRQKIHH